MFIYGLRSRGATIGTIPNNVTILNGKDISIKGYHDFIKSDEPLRSSQISNYELDFLSPRIWLDEIEDLRRDRIALFKNIDSIKRVRQLVEKLKEHHYKNIISIDNIKRGIQIKTSKTVVLLSMGFNDDYRLTIFDKKYEPISHRDFSTLDELIDEIANNYITYDLEVL